MTRPSEKRFDLVESFDALALAGKKPNTNDTLLNLVDGLEDLTLTGKTPDATPRHPLLRAGNPFIAGFRHNVILHDPTANRHIPQQSRAMRYALGYPNTPARPALAPHLAGLSPLPHPGIIVPPKVDRVVSTPPFAAVNALTPALAVTPGRPRSISANFVTSPTKGTVQCNGVTRAGKPCSRQVKLPPTHSRVDPIPVLYCHQHKVSLSSQTGFYVRKTGSPERFVEFSSFIPKYLQMDTQLALRVEMEKATSTSDEPGFIYGFEIRDPKRKDVIQLKVGRAVNLNKRFNEWDKQCASKEHIPRGFWPGTDDDGAAGSLLKGNIKADNPGPFCHRVERLVHIELADLSLHAPYLNPEWPDTSPTPTPESTPKKRPVKEERPCPDCGLVHKEIFTFRRPVEGRYQAKEWELIVKPVIEKWGEFVKDYYA